MKPKPPTRILRLEIGVPKKRKLRPRGDPSAIKAYQFKKGQVVAQPARKRTPDFMAKAYRVELDQPVPAEVAAAIGLTDCTWAEAIAFSMIRRAASGDAAAAKEVREVTEGRLPYKLTSEDSVINYSVRGSAKAALTAKILRGIDDAKT